jgi:hypothetical protein
MVQKVREAAEGAPKSTLPSRGETSSMVAASIGDRSDLENLDADLLRRRWRSVIGRAPPRSLSRALMIRILTWREQAAELGDLDARTRGVLAAALKGEGRAEGGGNDRPAGSRPRSRSSGSHGGLRSGAVLLREHAGVLHRVTALPDGFDWNGRMFKSLSSVARAITGTNWNGHRFFGLAQVRPSSPGESSSPPQGDGVKEASA